MKHGLLLLIFLALLPVVACQPVTPIVTALASIAKPTYFGPLLKLLAGQLGGYGQADGVGAEARFADPFGIAIDASGHVYVGDLFNHTIRKITPEGSVTTFIGPEGSGANVDQNGALAGIGEIRGMCFGPDGNLYVTDSLSHSIFKITPSGIIINLAGSGSPGSSDGVGAAASFSFPNGIAVDSAGTIFVADGSHTIRKITPGGLVSTFAGSTGNPGNSDGNGTAAKFNIPAGLVFDSAHNLYVADTQNSLIRKITPAGLVTTFAGTPGVPGSGDGAGSIAGFNGPHGLAIDSSDNILVSEMWNRTIRKITPAGLVTTIAGTAGASGYQDGVGISAKFTTLRSIAIDDTGNMFTVDAGNYSVRKITSAGVVTTFAGQPNMYGSNDGIGAVTKFKNPSAITIDSNGDLYVSDSENNTIRKITSGGIASTFAGSPGVTGGNDGVGQSANFNKPEGLAFDSAGNLFVADGWNNTIRRITPTGTVTTFAGAAAQTGSADGVGTLARFSYPTGLAVDKTDFLYVVDSGNKTIRKISPSGNVSTLAGTPGITGSINGLGAAASFNFPQGLAIDVDGNLYVSDPWNFNIRKVTPFGVVTTVAGVAGGAGSIDGNLSEARFNFPLGLTVDKIGNIYVADQNTIRKISPEGIVKTVIGNAKRAGVKLGSPAYLNLVMSIAVNGDSLYMSSENSILVCDKP